MRIIFPKDWRVGLTELNAFGYMQDREIIDLWGYTNPEIAVSREKNAMGQKINSEFLLKTQPEVIWCWWLWYYLYPQPTEKIDKSNYFFGNYEKMLTEDNG